MEIDLVIKITISHVLYIVYRNKLPKGDDLKMKREIKDDNYTQLGRKDPKRVAIYIRVSTDEQAKHGLSLEAQKKTLEDYCKKHGHRIVDTYIDEGLTARKTLRKRVEFNRMIEDVKKDKIDLIIFIKLDRWFRNVRDYYNTMDVLEAHNCTWIATEEDYDLSTSTGRLNLNIRLSISQNESDQTSDRINFVFANNRAEGRVVTGESPFGYKIEDKRYVIHEENAERVRDIFDYFTKQGSLMRTVSYYREKYNCRISYNSIKKYLKNTAYIGEYRTEKGELIPDYTPPIIDRDTFEYAQILIGKNVKGSRNNSDPSEFIFGGLLVCNTCGSKYARNCKIKRLSNGSMKQYYYYRCYRVAGMNCENKKTARQENLEDELLSMIKTEAEKYIAENKIKGTKQVNRPVDNTAKIKTKLKNLRELFIDGDIEKEEYLKRKQVLEKELNDNIALLNSVDTPKDTSHLERLLDSDFETIYHSLNNDNKRRFWASFIDKIYIQDKKVAKIDFL